MYMYIAGSQNTTKFIALYCTICYTTTYFGLVYRHTPAIKTRQKIR